MSRFIIRVELHGANWDDYVEMAACLASKNIIDEVPLESGGMWKLPPAEYQCTGDLTAKEVHDIVKQCVDATKKKHAIVVAKSDDIYVSGASSQA